jgi:hypothetical protein
LSRIPATQLLAARSVLSSIADALNAV